MSLLAARRHRPPGLGPFPRGVVGRHGSRHARRAALTSHKWQASAILDHGRPFGRDAAFATTAPLRPPAATASRSGRSRNSKIAHRGRDGAGHRWLRRGPTPGCGTSRFATRPPGSPHVPQMAHDGDLGPTGPFGRDARFAKQPTPKSRIGARRGRHPWLRRGPTPIVGRHGSRHAGRAALTSHKGQTSRDLGVVVALKGGMRLLRAPQLQDRA
jgi:hypothetical protein